MRSGDDGIFEPLAGTAPAVWEKQDDRFEGIRGDKLLERLWTGGRWVEGPVYSPAGRYLLWSDIPNDRILRWDETIGTRSAVFRHPAGNTNGHTARHRGPPGQLRARRTAGSPGPSTTASITVHRRPSTTGKRLNSPNDVVVQARRLGLVHRPGVRDRHRLRGLQGRRSRRAVATSTGSSPDGRADSGRRRLRPAERAGLLPRRIVALHRRLAQDGDTSASSTVDGDELVRRRPVRRRAATGSSTASGSTTEGRIWASAADGVHVLPTRTARCSASSSVPETVSNLTWGGPEAQPPLPHRRPRRSTPSSPPSTAPPGPYGPRR